VQDLLRDLDVVRELLQRIEQDPGYDNTSDNRPTLQELRMEDHSEEEIAYDLALLIRKGYVNGDAENGYSMPTIRGLTWEGHELLADISDPAIWAKTKERAKDLTQVGIGFVWEIAKSEIKKKLHLP